MSLLATVATLNVFNLCISPIESAGIIAERHVALSQAVAAPPPPVLGRRFTAPVGIILQAVRADRTQDFEYVMGLLLTAVRTSSDPIVQEQARGWRIFKATEQTIPTSVVYVFVLNPTVVGADYSIGPILAKAYPERIGEIWRMYVNSLTPDASLLNLVPMLPQTGSPAIELAPVAPQ